MPLFLIFFTLLSLLHLYCCYFKLDKLRRATKPLLLLSLSVYYFFAASPPNPLVLAGLLLGMAGDILLIGSYEKKRFVAGALLFTAGHACYCGVLFQSAAASGVHIPWWAVALLVLPYGVEIMIAALHICPHMKDASLKPLMPMYLGVVCVVNVGAWLCFLSALRGGGNSFGGALLVLGGICFLVSDTILACSLFRGGVKHDNFYVMLTYLAAQACLCFGFLYYL